MIDDTSSRARKPEHGAPHFLRAHESYGGALRGVGRRVGYDVGRRVGALVGYGVGRPVGRGRGRGVGRGAFVGHVGVPNLHAPVAWHFLLRLPPHSSRPSVFVLYEVVPHVAPHFLPAHGLLVGLLVTG